MQKSPIYSTCDLHLASALITLKYFMEGIDYQFEGNRDKPVGYFNFRRENNIDEAVKKYRQGQCLVDAKSLFSNMQALLAEIKNVCNNPHSALIPKEEGSN